MLLDLIDLSKLRRAIIYALLFLVLFVLQDLVISHITVFGVRALLVPAAVVAVGLLDGGAWGGFAGLAAGYFCDMGMSEQTVLFTILLSGIGFFCGVLGKYLLHKGFVSYVVLSLISLAIITYCQMARFLFFTDTDAMTVYRTGLIQVLYSLAWALPIYLPCRSIAARPLKR